MNEILTQPVALTESEVRAAFHLHRGNGWPERLALLPFDATIGFWWLLGAAFWVFFEQPAVFVLATFVAGVWTVAAVFDYAFTWLRIAGLYGRQSTFRMPGQYSFDADGVSITTAARAVRIPWGKINRWKRGAGMVLLYRSLGVVIPIPERCLESAQVAALLAVLRRQRIVEVRPRHRQPLIWLAACIPMILSIILALLISRPRALSGRAPAGPEPALPVVAHRMIAPLSAAAETIHNNRSQSIAL